MKCPHCLKEIHAVFRWLCLESDADGTWAIEQIRCPNQECRRTIIYLVSGKLGKTGFLSNSESGGFETIEKRIQINPRGSNRPPIPPEVREELLGVADDYTEACLILPDSPKASAALSRRCLQHLLREKANVKPTNLADEIQEVLARGGIPSDIAGSIDAIRNVGNLAAHPLKSGTTGEIVDVEPWEAEWNLDVLEELFDFYFVRPARILQKRAALNQKLQDAGKPSMK